MTDFLIIFLATYLWYAVMAGVMVFLAVTLFPKFRKLRHLHTELVIFTLISAFLARFVITEIIRFFYNSPRPFEVLDGVRKLVEHEGGKSFPSGHAALAFATASAISFYYPKIGILFFISAILIGVGRVAAGVHWPSDILGGAAVGIITAWLLKWAHRSSFIPILANHFSAKSNPGKVVEEVK